jgi:hypothetical protein
MRKFTPIGLFLRISEEPIKTFSWFMSDQLNKRNGTLCEFTCPLTMKPEDIVALFRGWQVSVLLILDDSVPQGFTKSYYMRVTGTTTHSNLGDLRGILRTASFINSKDRKEEIGRVLVEISTKKESEMVPIDDTGFIGSVVSFFGGSSWQYPKLLENITNKNPPSQKDISNVLGQFTSYWDSKYQAEIVDALGKFQTLYSRMIQENHKLAFYYAWFGAYILLLPDVESTENLKTEACSVFQKFL